MGDKGGFFKNPFAKGDKKEPKSAFMEPQPGDPGYKEPKETKEAPSAPPMEAVKENPFKSLAKKLPVIGDRFDDSGSRKRGLDLLREDFLKTGPVKVGVGRQDDSAIMKPLAGEPGFKPAAYETVRVSELGISPFPDDKNAVGKVGGVEAVKKAALEVKRGEATAKEIKKKLLKIKIEKVPEVYDIPDYLKPIPEDTPRKGLTWKNYVGR